MKFSLLRPGLLLASALVLTGCTSVPPANFSAAALSLSGRVHGGQQPVSAATLQLYAVGTTGDGSAATPLLLTRLTTSDGTGNAANANANAGNSLNTLPAGFFTLTGTYTCPASSLVYLVATGGNPGLAPGTNNLNFNEMAALGPCSSLTPSTNVSIDELTTVATVAALANFISSPAAIGSGASDSSQLAAAFANVNQYVNTSNGSVPGPALPPGSYASGIEIQTLGDAVSACVNSPGGLAGSATPCGALFTDATPSGQPAPTSVIAALINIIQNPTLNVCAIYSLVPAQPPYQPTLSACPASWSLPITVITVSVSGPASVFAAQSAQYTATVTGNANQGVSWSVNAIPGGNASVGTISTAGVYTAPATPPSSAVSISAKSVLASSTGSTTVTVLPVTVSVSGPSDVLFGQTGQYTASVTGSPTQSVTWSVNGTPGGSAAEGTITAAGVYTAPASTPPAQVVLSAQSTAVSSASGSLNLTVSPTPVTFATGDPRTVTQPTYPAVCATLTAQFTSSQRSTPPAAASDDTARIQAALNSAACKNTGLAVELASSGSNNAFFSELITLNGEGLTIDSGVTLFGGAAYANQSELVLIKGPNSSLMGPGAVDGRGDILAGSARLVQASTASNLTVYNVTLQQSIAPNLYIQGGSGVTVWGITILTPANRTNADGIDIDSLTNATVINSTIESGDDGVAVKTNAAAASNITVTNNKLYGTHGLSIGSQTFLGVSNILFSNNYVYGTDLLGNTSANANGINIKTDPSCGGNVQQVTYQNTCMSGVKHLIILNTLYGSCSGNPGTPIFSNILINGVLARSSISGAYSQMTGINAASPITAALANINLDATTLAGNAPTQNANLLLYNSNLVPTGNNVTTSTFSSPGAVPVCTF